MPLDPQCQAVLEPLNAAATPSPDQIPVDMMRTLFKQFSVQREAPPIAVVQERDIPGAGGSIGARIYRPSDASDLPVLVFYHGGGFVLCDLDTHDATCRELANAAGCVVVSVDYRLAPEHPFPAAPEDCYAATRWVAENAGELGADPSRLAIAGDSAGGNLTAAVSLLARERGGPSIVHQLLIYPVTNHDFGTASYAENAEGYLLTQQMMRWFWGHYLEQESDGSNPLASPLRAEDLSDLPPATLITAEYDPLRDEGEAYGERLREAGVAVDSVRYDGMIHGFFAMTAEVDRAADAVQRAAQNLRKAFGA